MAALTSNRPILVLGVEKMWTGNRAETLAGIEDGLPADYRADMHDRFIADENPSGSVLMDLNARWRPSTCASVARPSNRWPPRRSRRGATPL